MRLVLHGTYQKSYSIKSRYHKHVRSSRGQDEAATHHLEMLPATYADDPHRIPSQGIPKQPREYFYCQAHGPLYAIIRRTNHEFRK